MSIYSFHNDSSSQADSRQMRRRAEAEQSIARDEDEPQDAELEDLLATIAPDSLYEDAEASAPDAPANPQRFSGAPLFNRSPLPW